MGGVSITRAFICVEIPDEIKERMIPVVKQLVKSRPVSKDNIHVTLLFLGEISEDKLERVKAIMQKLEYNKFECSIKGIGTFSINQPGVIFAKVEEGNNALTDIYRLLFDDIERLDIQTDYRGYHPHITIARISNPEDRKLAKVLIEKNSDIEFGRFMCDSIKLKGSILTDKGPIYTDLYKRELV